MEESVKDLKIVIKKLRQLVELKEKLLVCYRIGKSPSGKVLDKLSSLNQWERNLE